MTLLSFADAALHAVATAATLTVAWASLSSYRQDRERLPTRELIESDTLVGVVLVLFLAVMLGAIWL